MMYDIFGVPVWKTGQAIRNEFVRLIQSLTRLSLRDKNNTFDFLTIQTLVYSGFLSSQSASYFLSGRFSPAQELYLRSFIKFLNDFTMLNGYSFSKIRDLWLQRTEKEAPVASFVFPLEELGCNFDSITDVPQWSSVVDDLPE